MQTNIFLVVDSFKFKKKYLQIVYIYQKQIGYE